MNVDVFKHTTYRGFLRDTLASRIQRNPRYSLRAFAAFLKISPGTLSQVLGGTVNFSPRMARRIGDRLGMSEVEGEYFLALVHHDSTPDPALRADFQRRLNELNPQFAVKLLSEDSFRLVADWYHFPVLHLLSVRGFHFSPRSIATRLGITVDEASGAIERLSRLGLISLQTDGSFAKDANCWQVASDFPSQALRKFHREMLSKAIEALETQTPDEKFIGSETFAFDRSRLPQAKRTIDAFMMRMVETFTKGSAPNTDVFHLGVQFFNLTPEKIKKTERSQKCKQNGS